MPTYTVTGLVTVTCWTEVEADSPEEAILIAKQRYVAEHHIDGSFEVEDYFHFDNDGTPTELRIEK